MSRCCGVEKGHFGFTDMVNTRFDGTQKLVAELTIKDGKIVYDLNGLEALPWDAPQGDISPGQALDVLAAAGPQADRWRAAALIRRPKNENGGELDFRLSSPFFVLSISRPTVTER